MKFRARYYACILLPAALAVQPALAAAAAPRQAPEAHYRAFDSKGRAVALGEILEAARSADVLIIGETHNDPVAHLLEAELLRRADELLNMGAQRDRRAVALSLEMFDRDVQPVLDEYLAGLISERHFLLSSRPWRNYETDYRPLVEYARGRALPVIAANAPARYVSRVSANGPDSLRALPEASRRWLPPLPFPPASEPYAAKFRSFLSGESAGAHTQPASRQQSPHSSPALARQVSHGGSYLLDAQTLRDASMAHAIAEHLKQRSGALVVHVNGKFHSEERLGVPEQLLHYRAKARAVVVTILPGEGFPNFDAARLGPLGDFVILTDPAIPRSY